MIHGIHILLYRVISDDDNGGLSAFDTQETTEDPFRRDPNQFPRDQNFNNQQQFMNTFQNNEIGSNNPINPFDTNRNPISYER